MALVTLHTRVFGVIEVGLRHPPVHQDRVRDDRPGARHFHLVTKSASGKVRARHRGILALRLIGAGLEKDRSLEFLVAAELGA
jgi:hypothetical protein